MKRLIAVATGLTAALAVAGSAAAHWLDHPAPAQSGPSQPLSTNVNAGGENAEWELLATIPTSNPHSDLDFFTHKGDTYASVGALGTGPNGGGQTIVRLTEAGEIKPSFVSAHPSASCPTGSSSVTGLQHDVEATPKGDAFPQQVNRFIPRGRDAQLLIDTTDAGGRCHDQGAIGVTQSGQVPQGGLEIIDVTDPATPKEIALTSHIGQAHTTNVDPKRPHIAFAVTQDNITATPDGKRSNETTAGDFNDLDGFEVVDLSSCMNFPPGTTIEAKRAACRPQVYRFRYPSALAAQSHTYPNLQGCHEIEIYPDDRITCAGIDATALFDFSGAFDDRGTPTDFTDDKPRGTPLPCRVRESSTAAAPFRTGAPVIDCVNGEVNGQPQSLNIPEWLKIGAPSLEGAKWIGSVPHMGFASQPDIVNAPHDSTKDILAAHESELTGSGRFVLTTDERGGGTLPPGASCSPGADNVRGNGGIHAFPVSSFTTSPPRKAEEAWKLWAKDSKGNQAIFRAPVRTQPQGALCTAHVFQQIPGQNRIFMGWYTQGTQVVDFSENADGTIDFKLAGWFTPEGANTWVSHIFKAQENPDGSFTYWGATGDGILQGTGRGAIDVYKVTLPAPPRPRGGDPIGGGVIPKRGLNPNTPCARASAFERVTVTPRRRGLRFSWARRGAGKVRVDLFQQSAGRRIVGERRVKSFGNRAKGFSWSGRGRRLRDGIYFARLSVRTASRATDVRRVALERRKGRWRVRKAFDARTPCALVDSFKLTRPVFGGRSNAGLFASFKLTESARVSFEIRRGTRVVSRLSERSYSPNRTHRVRFRRFKGPRGDYTVVMRASRPARSQELELTARKL